MTADLYSVLGVPRDAGDTQLKRAFRELAKIHHPDRNQGDPTAEERFKSAGYAYRVLADPSLRARYDKYGHDGLRDDFNPAHDWAQKPAAEESAWKRAPATGPAPLVMTVEVTPAEAAAGFTREVSYERQVRCTDCKGIGGRGPRPCGICNGLGKTRLGGPACGTCAGGGIRFQKPCGGCRGTAVSRAFNTLIIRVPAGATEDSIVRIKGKGHQRAKVTGDVHVRLRLRAGESSSSVAADLSIVVPISIGEATLGGKVPVETPAGRVMLTIPPGSSGGRRLRIKAHGQAVASGRGDVLAELRILVPRSPSDEARRLLQAFADLDDTLPRK
jgi:molecular chaperone DnaJ